MTTDDHDRFLAEWEPHGTVMLAWPHSATDWDYMLAEVQQCYRDLTDALLRAGERVLILAPRAEAPHIERPGVTEVYVDTNDTWIRDYGPLTLASGRRLDFRFNAWGQKFASNFDNMTTRALAGMGVFEASSVECHKDFVLEGGSIETDGRGTILTTSCCLLAPNRNEPLTRADIERRLLRRLRCRKVLWLECEPLDGDDTDGHIDTIARLAPDNVIVYTIPAHAEQLRRMTDADGRPFRLLRLPVPQPVADPADGSPLPATYANYLVTTRAVLMPTYAQPAADTEAAAILAQAFPGREIIGVDCRALIRQHGSLHCATMQIQL